MPNMIDMPCMECPCSNCAKAYKNKCGNCIGCNGFGFHQLDTFCEHYIVAIWGYKENKKDWLLMYSNSITKSEKEGVSCFYSTLSNLTYLFLIYFSSNLFIDNTL